MKSIKTLLVAAVAATMFTACSDDQSSFNVKDVPGRAVIQGTVVYNQGVELVDGKFVYDYTPAAGIELFVTLNNSDFDSNLSGTSVFSTFTDENGEYLIEVPVSEGNMSFKIRTTDFEGVYNFIDIENQKPVEKQDVVVYRGTASGTIDNHAIVFTNVTCGPNSTKEEFKGFTEYVTLTGKLGQNSEYYTPSKFTRLPEEEAEHFDIPFDYTAAHVEPVWVPAPNADVVVTISYGSQLANTKYPIKFNATTDANGLFSVNVPVPSFPVTFGYSVEGIVYNGSYTHYNPVDKVYNYTINYGEDVVEAEFPYTEYEPVTLNGWYQRQLTPSGSASYNINILTYEFDAPAMVFTASEEALKKFEAYYPSYWTSSSKWLDEYLEYLKEQEEAKNAAE